MAFRNVIVESNCKLDYALGYLVCKTKTTEKRVLINEMQLLLVSSIQVSITAALISQLIQNKVKIIFCDSKHFPTGEVVPYQNNYYSYRKINEQLSFSRNGEIAWMEIVKEKILNQANNLLLMKNEKLYEQLLGYSQEVELNDSTNREGHAAKVYFNGLFGIGFSRDNDSLINKYLNYGYSILLSLISREIKMFGYLTEIGIHHIGESNSFNFSCDLIEPLRPFIDKLVIELKVNEDTYKEAFVQSLETIVLYDGKRMTMDNAIHLYINGVIKFLKGECDSMKFIRYEL